MNITINIPNKHWPSVSHTTGYEVHVIPENYLKAKLIESTNFSSIS